MSLTAPTVTGYSGFWQLVGDKLAYSMSLSEGRSPTSKPIARYMARRQNTDIRAALAVVIGAAAGGTATGQWRRRPSPAGPNQATPTVSSFSEFGGVITASLHTLINRATTAADVAELKKWFDNTLLEAGITYPTVLGPNAGGKLVNGNVSF